MDGVSTTSDGRLVQHLTFFLAYIFVSSYYCFNDYFQKNIVDTVKAIYL